MDLAKTHNTESGNWRTNEAEQLNELVILGYSPMGAVIGSYGSVQVEAREVVMPGRQIATQSARVELTTDGDYPQTGFATVPYEEIPKLLLALEKMQFTNISAERFKFTEVQYEVEDLKITVFNNDRGQLMWALSVNSLQIHFNSLSKIGDLKDIVERAKAHLDKTKI